MDKLTDKQNKVLHFIKEFHLNNGIMPTVREIASHFKITIGPVQKYLQILQDKGHLIKKDQIARGLDIVNRQSFSAIPVLGSVHAGTFLEQIEDANDYVYINTNVTRSKQCFALKVKGDSMEPSGIVEGDTIVVSKGEKVYNGDIVVALVDGESAVKIFCKENNRICLKSSNPKYPIIYSDNIEIVGKLIYLVREYKG